MEDDFLPLISWGALSISLLNRDVYLKKFREIVGRVKFRNENFKEEIFVDHIRLGSISNAQFDYIFEPLLSEITLRRQLSLLAELKSLPDRDHWLRYQDEQSNRDVSSLRPGYMKCLDHQSQEATDLRWLIVMSHFANHKLVLGQENADGRFRECVEYPNLGDQRMVRPFIRSTEIALRNMWERDKELEEGKRPPQIAEAIWSELHLKTPCAYLPPLPLETFDADDTSKEVVRLYESLVQHFHETIVTTGIDARHDSAFGLILFAVSLLADALSLRPAEYVSAKLLLRSIVEAHINLRYLRMKDDRTIWFQFRNFGNAQAKLALLKYLDHREKPDYVDMEQLYAFANQDLWLEFQEIELGNWAKKNLREIAVEAKLKNVYDQHYQILSVTAHAHWTGIRETNFTVCLNPLHRLHLIPDAPRPYHASHIPEMCKLINQMLDDLNHLYPAFKTRLRKYKAAAQAEEQQKAVPPNSD
ncbi:MAG: hypothetical protein QOJ86_2504 [Bradyrhizobium sp.]|jgi:hypothetical protein|nr:hypothetical protein [Bradyrhizobium sp.]